MATLTLNGYDANNGDAYKIYVESVSDVKILTPSSVDETARLIASGVLVGSESDAVVSVFGADWSDVARYALGIKTPNDEPL